MARNQEKAMTMLARFREMKRVEQFGDSTKERRPYRTDDCTNLQEAEKWRRHVIKDISKKVSQIQNPGLGEYQIRDINDEINKLLKEKSSWEHRIIKLGGPNYLRMGPRMLAIDGKEVPGNKGYKYFGAAKDLPGVRDLLHTHPSDLPKRTRYDMYRHVDADYYGYRDDEDGLLMELEAKQEEIAIEEALREGGSKRRLEDPEERSAKIARMFEMEVEKGGEETAHEDAEGSTSGSGGGETAKEDHAKDKEREKKESLLKSHVAVPSQEDIQKFLLERKKQMLLDKYVSEDLSAAGKETRELTGRN